MATLPTLPEWVSLEHEVQRILTAQESHGWAFDETAAITLATTLSQELRKLKSYYDGNILSLEDQNSLLAEITAAKDMLRVHPLLD